MKYKVGDRVWAIDPPINLEESDPQDKGPGRVLEVNPRPFDGAYLVKLDSGKEWAYWETSLRSLLEPTPTPSITVGTQVRLTGVVVRQEVIDDAVWVAVKGGFSTDAEVLIQPEHFEVIRQPFKRGEVVWPINDTISEPWLVVADEEDGKVTAVLEKVRPGHNVVSLNVRNYERRP